ncbi:MAG: HEAT repeat domain-containing protein [Planctomycetales bacterium]
MNGSTSDSELIACPNCGVDVRRGMIRCRDCGGVIGEDFELADEVAAAVVQVPQCERCGKPLDPDIDDCPACASAMLDELLNSGGRTARETNEPAARNRQSGGGRSRGREGAPSAATRSPLPPPGKLRAGRERPNAISQEPEPGTDALYESETPATATRNRATVPDFERVLPQSAPEAPAALSSDACLPLIAALGTEDVDALCQVVVALGKMGDPQAMTPLERLMINPEVRVRRAVASALIQLGHPKGSSLLEIAERRVPGAPASPKVTAGYSKARAKNGTTDMKGLTKPLAALAAAILVGGTFWWWQSQPPSSETASAGKESEKAGKKGTIAKPIGAKLQLNSPTGSGAVNASPQAVDFGNDP